MAYGGIPVSGGVSGKGTLIHTNLLQAPLLFNAGVAWRPSWTLGGTAGATGYEAKFIKDAAPSTLFKTAASAGEITLTMKLAGSVYPTVYGVVLVGHNLADSNITTAKFEGGLSNYTDVSEDLVLNADTLTPAYHLLSTPATGKDQWRLLIQFSSSTALQIGEVFLIGEAPLAFARNFDWGGSLSEELGQVMTDGLAGVPRMRSYWKRYWREMQFTKISQTQHDALILAARNGYAVFSPEGDSGYAYYGLFSVQPSRDTFIDQLDLTGKFIEAAT
jgi:hypothetical protein